MQDAIGKVFTSVTAAPPHITGIKEIVPCAALKPFVRCFWECNVNTVIDRLRIIPDCCADIIIPLDGDSAAQFVSVSDKAFISENTGNIFGIRFNFWSVYRFTALLPEKAINISIDAVDLFKGFKSVQNGIVYAKTTTKRVEIAERYLCDALNGSERYADVLNCLYYALKNDCNINVDDMALYSAACRRSLERSFKACMGVSPKHAVEMLRYQLLWQACGSSSFDAMDCVERLGYYDYAHMYNDFKKYHGASLTEARSELQNLSQIYNTRQ